MMTRHTIVDTDFGPITLVATQTTDGDAISGLYFRGHRRRPARETFGPQIPAAEDPPLGVGVAGRPAVGANPLSDRAVPPGGRRDRTLTGYAGGLARKRPCSTWSRPGRRQALLRSIDSEKQPFEQVVAEHGPTVLRVCRAVLGPMTPTTPGRRRSWPRCGRTRTCRRTRTSRPGW